MISVTNTKSAGLVDEPCNSGNAEHSGPAIIVVFIGNPEIDGEPATHFLCEMCALKMLNATAFMISSITGKSPARLLGYGRQR